MQQKYHTLEKSGGSGTLRWDFRQFLGVQHPRILAEDYYDFAASIETRSSRLGLPSLCPAPLNDIALPEAWLLNGSRGI